MSAELYRREPTRARNFFGRGPALPAGLAVATIYAYGAGALWINRVSADQPYTLSFAVRETGRSLAGLSLGGSAHVGDSFGEWFPISVFILDTGMSTRRCFDPTAFRIRHHRQQSAPGHMWKMSG